MEDLFEERVCACALNRIFGFSPRYALALVRGLGSASAVFKADRELLDSITGPYFKFKGQICPEAAQKAADELASLEKRGCRFIAWTEEAYPKLLKDCDDAPVGLYVRSSSPPESIFNARPSVSVVGTRDISCYGSEWCPRIVRALGTTAARPAIVSGLALGIDICAHMAALSFGLPTIAVLPTGIDDVYPQRHRTAAGKIAEREGCALITDFPPGTPALRIHFLRRNRIIAGLGRATILVESKTRGGGTMTARLASGYGREVFALPGRIDDIRSGGCNLLIREQIAEPLTSLEGLGEALGLGSCKKEERRDPGLSVERGCMVRYGKEQTDTLVRIVRLIDSRRGVTPDEICRETGLGYGEVAMALGILENEGFICTDLLQRCSIAAGIP